MSENGSEDLPLDHKTQMSLGREPSPAHRCLDGIQDHVGGNKSEHDYFDDNHDSDAADACDILVALLVCQPVVL